MTVKRWWWLTWPSARLAVVLMAALMMACRDEPAAPPTPSPVVQVTVFRVVVTAPRQVLSPGDSVQLSAQAFDAQGRVLPNASIAWSSGSPTTVSVDARGVATAVGVGSAEVTATAGGQSGSATLTVNITRLCDCTRIVDSTLMSLLQRNDTSGTYVFRVASGREPGIAPGDIMVGAQGAGYLRRVRTVTRAGDRVTVETTTAYLDEAVRDGAFAATSPIDDLLTTSSEGVTWGSWTTTHISPGVTMSRNGLCCSLNGVGLALKSDTGLIGKPAKVSVEFTIKEGDIDFLPRFEVSSNIENFRLQTFRATVRGGVDLNIDVYELKVTAALTDDKELTLKQDSTLYIKQRPFSTFIGPMPVVGIVSYALKLKVTPTVSASAVFTGHFNTGFGVTVGTSWTRGTGWKPVSSASSHFDASAPKFQGVEGSASVKIALVPEVSVQFYGVAGPKIDLEPYAEGAATAGLSFAGATPTGLDWETRASLGLNLNVGAKISILGRVDLAEASFAIPIIKPYKLIRGFSDGPLAIHTRVTGDDLPDSIAVRLRPNFVDTLPPFGRDLATSSADVWVAANGGTTLNDVRSGTSFPHVLSIPNLPGNCAFVAGDGDGASSEEFVARKDTVVVSSSAFITFGGPPATDTLDVSCIPMGSLRVRTKTTGRDAPAQHRLTIERRDTVGTGLGRPPMSMGVRSSVEPADTVISGLNPANPARGATGEHMVQLEPGRRNCAVTKPSSRQTFIVSKDTMRVDFDVRCVALGHVVAHVTTADPDSATPSAQLSYRLQVVDRDAPSVSATETPSTTTLTPTGSAVVSELVPLYSASGATGRHSVSLADAPNRCTESASYSRQVTVFSDDTATTDFTVKCVERLHVQTASSGPGTDADGYIVIVENADGTADSVAIAPTDTVAIAGITPGTHTIRLADVDGSCATPASVSRTVSARDSTLVSFAVPCVGPAAPRALRTTRVESTRIDLAWDAAPGVHAPFFRLYRSTTGASALLRDSVVATSFDDLGLPSYTRFVYRVTSVDANGLEGPKSAPLDVRTRDGTPPTAPSSVTASATNASTIALSWSAAVDGESGIRRYRVFRDGVLIDSTTSTSYVSRGLAAVTWYTYHVAAVNGESLAGPLSAPATELTPDGTPPTAPPSLVATAVGTTRIDLSWLAAKDPETGISNYRIYRNGTLVDTTRGTTFADTGLTPATTYVYEVAARNGAGAMGPRSAPATATTAALPPPPPPPPPPPDTGSISVTVRTSGSNVPTANYQVQLRAGPVTLGQPLSPNGGVTFAGLAVQGWTVLLHGLPPNCNSVDGANPRVVPVVANITATTRFVVSCR